MAEYLASFVESKCATIAEITDGNDLRLDEGALESILMNPKLQDKPLMVVSIAGAFRKGKSFMLTFLMRYLQNKGHMYVNWLSLQAIRDGFHWRGGAEPVTTGVTMWKEPFFVKDDREREVAVLLMDTQGLFDHESEMNFHSRVFAFSTMISSVQVYNVSQQIQGYDLDHLEFFVEYAKAVRTPGGMNRIPFQKLVFLVRDWSDPKGHKYGYDGDGCEKGYLPGILKKKASCHVGENLKTSFESVDCFLMPYPGSKVAVRQEKFEFLGDLKDIDDEFKKYAKRFAIFLFSSTNLVPKKINGIEVCARDLLSYAVSCAKQFREGVLPEIGSMIETTAVTLCIKISESLVKKYEEAMGKVVVQCLSESELKKKHEVQVENLLSQFATKAVFGEKDLIEKHSDALKTNLDGRYAIFARSNETKKRKMDADMHCWIAQHVEKNFLSKMGASDSSQKIQHLREEILRKFSTDFRGYTSLSSYTDVLKKKLDDEVERREKKKAEEKEKCRISGTEKCLEELRSLVGAKVAGKCLDKGNLKEKCNELKTEILDRYCENLTWPDPVAFKTKVGIAMDNEIEDIIHRNYLKEEAVRLLFQNEIDELLTTYMKVMEEGMKSVYVRPDVMKVVHEKMKKMLEKKLRSNEKIKEDYDGRELWVEFLQKMNENLDGEFRKQLAKNEAARALFPRTLSSETSFFATAAWVIAIAIGIPAAIFYGLFLGISGLVKVVKDKLGKKKDE